MNYYDNMATCSRIELLRLDFQSVCVSSVTSEGFEDELIAEVIPSAVREYHEVYLPFVEQHKDALAAKRGGVRAPVVKTTDSDAEDEAELKALRAMLSKE